MLRPGDGEFFFDGHDDINCLALSNDRRHLISGSDDGMVLCWDVGNGELVGSPCKGYEVAVSSVAYSPDGKRVVSGYSDGTVRIYEVASGRIGRNCMATKFQSIQSPFRKMEDI